MAGGDRGDTLPDTGRGDSVSALSSEHAVGGTVKIDATPTRGPRKQGEPLRRLPAAERKNRRNHTIKRGSEIAPSGEGARIRANIEALQTLQRLINSGEVGGSWEHQQEVRIEEKEVFILIQRILYANRTHFSELDRNSDRQKTTRKLMETEKASKEETDYAPKDSRLPATKGTALTSTTLKANAKLAKVSENLVKRG